MHGANPFGRVTELWFNDMGLGPVGPQFQVIFEEVLIEFDTNGDIEDDGNMVERMEENV